MALKIEKHPDTGRIVHIQTNPGIFSYSYLVTPRPESDLKAGTFGTDFIIQDDETYNAIKLYLKEAIEDGKEDKWKGVVPKDIHLPLRRGKEDVESEKGKWVLQTSSNRQPSLFIRDASGRAYEATSEEDFEELYPGMEGEIIIKVYPYDFKGNKGLKAYLNAACKTGVGTPFVSKINYKSVFSLENSFDDVKEEPEDDISALLEDKPKKPAAKAPAKKPTAKVQVEEEPTEEFALEDLLASQEPAAPAKKAKASAEMTLDDLLK